MLSCNHLNSLNVPERDLDNEITPITELNKEDLLVGGRYGASWCYRCSGCGKSSPQYFNKKWKLFVCGESTCKPYDIMAEWARHAMTGE